MEVTAYFDNDKSALVTDYVTDPEEGTEVTMDLREVEVSYTFRGVTKSDTLELGENGEDPVRHRELLRIEITGELIKKEYVEGDVFDPAGLTVTAYYNNGKSNVIGDEEGERFDVIPSGGLGLTDTTVTISYTEREITKTGTCEITVIPGNEIFISTKEELIQFRDDVNGGNPYEGMIVHVVNDIDLEGNENDQWIPIGTYENPFRGIFDGEGHVISGIYINHYNYTDTIDGLFGVNEGTIQNLGTEGIIKTNHIAGGIVGNNLGNINRCYSNVELYGNINTVGLGGITGWNGLVKGSNTYNGIIEECYNKGKIEIRTSMEETKGYGGVAGINEAGIVKNSYNIGKIENSDGDNTSKNYVGSIVGIKFRKGEVTNCYYLDTARYKGLGTEVTSAVMRSRNFVSTINNGNSSAFEYDENTVNNGYPRLYWQTGSGMPIEEELYVNITNYVQEQEGSIVYLKRIKGNTTLTAGLRNITTNGQMEVYDKNNNKVTNYAEKIKTGMTLRITKGEERREYILVVIGDLTGDGIMDDIDLLKMARYQIHLDTSLEGAYLKASDILGNNAYATDLDLLKMARVLINLDTL